MIDVATLLPWQPPFRSPSGRMVRRAVPSETFWETWRVHRDDLRTAGVQPSRSSSGHWVVYWNFETAPAAIDPKAPAPKTLDPEIAALLRDYQRTPATLLSIGFDSYAFEVDTSDTGAGKSYVAMAVCRQRGLQPVIICRKAAFSAWKKVAAYFGFDNPTISNCEKVRNGNSPLGTWRQKKREGKRSIKIFEWALPAGSLLILDELHWYAGNRTLNSQLLTAATYQRITTLGASATVADSPLKLRAIGHALGLHKGHDFDEWAYAHGCEKGKFGLEFTCGIPRGRLYKFSHVDKDTDKPVFTIVPEVSEELAQKRLAVMQRIHQTIAKSGRGVRIRIDDVPGFPEVEIVPHLMNFDTCAEIEVAYDELQWELNQMKKTGDRLGIMRKAHQKIELLKVELVAEEVNELVEQGYSVPIFTNFTASLEKLCELCKTDCRVFGTQSTTDRNRSLEEFQANAKHVIVLNNQAGGESIGLHDLLGQRQRISYIFPTFWATALRQVLGRSRRDGALSKSICRIAYAADTIEETIMDSVSTKLERLDTLNDGDLSAGLSTI